MGSPGIQNPEELFPLCCLEPRHNKLRDESPGSIRGHGKRHAEQASDAVMNLGVVAHGVLLGWDGSKGTPMVLTDPVIR